MNILTIISYTIDIHIFHALVTSSVVSERRPIMEKKIKKKDLLDENWLILYCCGITFFFLDINQYITSSKTGSLALTDKEHYFS